jgi:hypothetical protein
MNIIYYKLQNNIVLHCWYRINLPITIFTTIGTKAMYEILKRGKFHNLSISCQLVLFDKVVKPILLYGCELWGLSNCDIIERVHLKYCKLLLNLKSSTPNCMIYGELERYSLYIDIKQRMVSYWTKLITGKQSQICSVVYRLM